MDETNQALQVEKLYTEVVEDVLNLTGQEPIKIWLRPLRYPVENARAAMAYRETYDLMIESGSTEEDSSIAGYLATRLQTLFYVVRKTADDKSPRLFESIRQAASVRPEEQERLLQKYQDSFLMSEEDLGNSLRVKTVS